MNKILMQKLLITTSLTILVFVLVLYPEVFLVSTIKENDLTNLSSKRVIKPNNQSGEVLGDLEWEKDENFITIKRKSKVVQRISAFQTFLPDPLPGEEYNVMLASDILSGTVLEQGELFSMNRVIGPYTKDRGFKEGPTYNGTQVIKTVGGGVCKIASTLYNVAALANLEIIERHPHSMLVPYVPAGQDATVAYGKLDFKFRNNTGGPLLIWSGVEGNTLYIAFYGSVAPPKVSWHHRILRRQKTYTVYRDTKSLQTGVEKVLTKGEDGLTIKSWLTIEYANGESSSKQMGIDYYKPMPRVVERGVNTSFWE